MCDDWNADWDDERWSGSKQRVGDHMIPPPTAVGGQQLAIATEHLKKKYEHKTQIQNTKNPEWWEKAKASNGQWGKAKTRWSQMELSRSPCGVKGCLYWRDISYIYIGRVPQIFILVGCLRYISSQLNGCIDWTAMVINTHSSQS